MVNTKDTVTCMCVCNCLIQHKILVIWEFTKSVIFDLNILVTLEITWIDLNCTNVLSPKNSPSIHPQLSLNHFPPPPQTYILHSLTTRYSIIDDNILHKYEKSVRYILDFWKFSILVIISYKVSHWWNSFEIQYKSYNRFNNILYLNIYIV